MEKYYIQKSIDKLKEQFPDGVTKDLAEFVSRERYVFEEIYVEADQAERVLDFAGNFEAPTPAPATEEEGAAAGSKEESKNIIVYGKSLAPPGSVLVKTRVWRRIEMLVKALSAHEVFMIWLKAAFISGLIMSSPWVFYQIWMFVAAGLYPHEKRYVHVFLPVSLLLFLAGAATAFFFVFEPVLDFLFSFNKAMNIDPDPRISEWISFVLFMPLGFGLSFQLPLVMLFLERIGLFSIAQYIEKWRIAMLVIFVLSMFLTPADPISMLLMACPLTILYFLGIAMCRWMPKGWSRFSDVYEP